MTTKELRDRTRVVWCGRTNCTGGGEPFASQTAELKIEN